MMRGAVWDGERLLVTDALEVRAPGPGEVAVRVLASGICRSDLSVMDHGSRAPPIVLGHEAAGVIDGIGEGVEGFAIGDPVAVCTQTPCGACRDCAGDRTFACVQAYGAGDREPFRWRGRPAYSFANCSSFAERIVIRASQAHGCAGVPMEQAALIGCAVTTGVGAARKLAPVRGGDSVVVIGVGVNALQGARLAGAARIVAVDISADRSVIAERFGADSFVAVTPGDSAGTIRSSIERVAGPVDVVIDCSGSPAAIEAAIALPRRGGAVVLVGMPRAGTRVSFDVPEFTMGRAIVSIPNGGISPGMEFGELVDRVRDGSIDVAAQISGVWPLGEITDAIAALRRGEVIRAVLDMTR